MQYKTWAPLSGLSTYMSIIQKMYIQKMYYPKYVYYPENVLTLCFIFPLSENFDQHLFSLFSLKLMLNIKKWPPYFFSVCLFV